MAPLVSDGSRGSNDAGLEKPTDEAGIACGGAGELGGRLSSGAARCRVTPLIAILQGTNADSDALEYVG